MTHILAEISTKNRYDVLPMAIQSVLMQTRKPDELVIFDDNESITDLTMCPTYHYLFTALTRKGIKWSVRRGAQKGQHYNHQKAQELAKDLVWRLDDDNIAEPDVLEKLEKQMVEGVGAVGGLVLEPGYALIDRPEYKKLDFVSRDIQWGFWKGDPIEAEHLYSTFLYRKGIAKYDLRLSPAAHREETIFSHKIFKAGYKLIIDPSAITWHFRAPGGGIRTYTNHEYWRHDEELFRRWIGEGMQLVVLDNGIGDHIVMRKLLDDMGLKPTIACCYPEIFEGFEILSIAQAKDLCVIDDHNIYKFMDEHNWKDSLYNAFKELHKGRFNEWLNIPRVGEALEPSSSKRSGTKPKTTRAS